MKYENIIQCQFSTKKEQAMHFHQDIEILYVLDGSLEIEYEEEKHFLGTDQFLLVNSNVRHAYHAVRESTDIQDRDARDTELPGGNIKGTDLPDRNISGDVLVGSLFIDNTMLTEIFGGEQQFFWCDSAREHSESYEKMRYYIRQIFNYYQTVEGQGIALRNSIYYQLIYLITTDFIVKKGMSKYESLRGIQDERLNEILSYIMTNYREPITLKELADRLFLSHTYLSKYIKNNFGMSFLKLLNNIRLDHAVSDLLYTDKTILKVAMDNGFSNQAGLNHAFRETYHMTPAEYRCQMAEKLGRGEEQENSAQVMERVEQYLASNLVRTSDAADSIVQEMEIDTTRKDKVKRNWSRIINVGEASDLLRFDVREHLQYMKEQLHFEYVRFWNLLADDMMIELKEKNSQYNFKLIDQIFDFLVKIGVKPHVELGFKGRDFFVERVDLKMLSLDLENQIDLIDKNRIFLEELIRHLTRRYGISTVEEWYFELEQNAVIQKKVPIDHYFEAFDAITEIFRTYAPNVKIGGAGFSMNYIGEEFPEVIAKWAKRKHRPDFISICSYPYLVKEHLLDAGRNPYSPDEDYLYHQIRRAKQVIKEAGFDVPEFFVTEWSSTLSNRNCLNDGCYKGAYVMKNLIQNYDEADAIAYWSATDIFAERIDSDELLFGGCGLISRDGIRKPAFFAFEHLVHLEKYFLGKSRNAIASGNGKGLFYICCHNYKHFNFRYYSLDENQIEIERQPRLFEDQEALQMSFKLHPVNNGIYQIKVFSVNQENGNVQNEWEKLGYFNALSVTEVQYLRTICQPGLTIRKAEAYDHTLVVETRLAAQEIQGIVISEL